MQKDTKRHPGTVQWIEFFYNEIPSFTDIFTEETFYIFVVCFVTATIILAAILSRFIKIRAID